MGFTNELPWPGDERSLDCASRLFLPKEPSPTAVVQRSKRCYCGSGQASSTLVLSLALVRSRFRTTQADEHST